MSIISEDGRDHTGYILKVYDLRDPHAWMRAGQERSAWGRYRTEIHRLDNDHVVIEYKPGGALEASA